MPNNGGGNTYNVFIDGGNTGQNTTVSLNMHAWIDITVDTGEALSINNDPSLGIAGSSISNSGSISVNSAGGWTSLYVAGTVTFSDGGTVSMGNLWTNRIIDNADANGHLINAT